MLVYAICFAKLRLLDTEARVGSFGFSNGTAPRVTHIRHQALSLMILGINSVGLTYSATLSVNVLRTKLDWMWAMPGTFVSSEGKSR